ncbi:MAG: hypothetical protein ACRD1H_09935, partial [Vicinamibacterales bacterium]
MRTARPQRGVSVALHIVLLVALLTPAVGSSSFPWLVHAQDSSESSGQPIQGTSSNLPDGPRTPPDESPTSTDGLTVTTGALA